MTDLTGELPFLREVQPNDLPQLRPLFEYWMRDSETGQILANEVDATLQVVDATASGNKERKYIVAEGAGGAILGIMGLTGASEKLASVSPAAEQGDAAELITAFVASDARHQRIGTLLVKYLEASAKELAYNEVLVISGPRYEHTGWHFWTSLYGEPIAVQKDAFGPGFDAPVWRKSLRVI